MNAVAAPLWAITAFFNPIGYRRRRENYRVFRRRLGVPLLTVELGYDGRFELAREDADRLLQLRGIDVLWQKERLLNVAVAALPDACRYVAWLDCDIVFEREDWPELALAQLAHDALVQPFQQAIHLPRDMTAGSPGVPAANPEERSLGYLFASGAAIPPPFSIGSQRRAGIARGIAWAAPRSLLQRHGFYDACIVGGGDTAFAAAAVGAPESAVSAWRMAPRHAAHYLAWAHRIGPAVSRRISFVPGKVYHLWHGEIRDRQYRQRHYGLEPFDFDPATDIRVDDGGAWCWATAKPELHAYVARYFAARNEDGDADTPMDPT